MSRRYRVITFRSRPLGQFALFRAQVRGRLWGWNSVSHHEFLSFDEAEEDARVHAGTFTASPTFVVRDLGWLP